ncbi:hypothetical protein EVAR_95430_1 [Eumeta japonica]|uniref:Reverse transcriptase domain-containing protein n=1 Tax=Eumeta variegata TaxID=151549 RepID=A0A4C1VHD6_EUMVA|nr:hypothetical protein EVAR_95430_1 [Eumeta japonica]
MHELPVKCLLHADDQVILAPSECGLQEMVNEMKKKGIKVNNNNIKVMVLEKGKSTTECDMLIEGEKVEQVKKFLYLGSLFTNDGKHDRDIERKVNARNKVNGALQDIMNSKSVLRQACLAIQNGV